MFIFEELTREESTGLFAFYKEKTSIDVNLSTMILSQILEYDKKLNQIGMEQGAKDLVSFWFNGKFSP